MAGERGGGGKLGGVHVGMQGWAMSGGDDQGGGWEMIVGGMTGGGRCWEGRMIGVMGVCAVVWVLGGGGG